MYIDQQFFSFIYVYIHMCPSLKQDIFYFTFWFLRISYISTTSFPKVLFPLYCNSLDWLQTQYPSTSASWMLGYPCALLKQSSENQNPLWRVNLNTHLTQDLADFQNQGNSKIGLCLYTTFDHWTFPCLLLPGKV